MESPVNYKVEDILYHSLVTVYYGFDEVYRIFAERGEIIDFCEPFILVVRQKPENDNGGDER